MNICPPCSWNSAMKTLYPFFWSNTMKTFLTSAAAACLTLCIGVSAQGDAFATYTTLDVPGASSTYAYDIDGTNIVGFFYDGSDSVAGSGMTARKP